MVGRDRINHRVAQFFRVLLACFQPLDKDYAAGHLSPDLYVLFCRMSRAEKQHGIAVCRALEAQGESSPDVLVAALLHDIGKSRLPPRLWERVIVVLVEHYLPHLAARWREGQARGLRRGFVVRYRHPRWGAEFAAAAGASPRTVDLILRHHTPPGDDTQLAALQALDEG